jgi:hypothetical protein
MEDCIHDSINYDEPIRESPLRPRNVARLTQVAGMLLMFKTDSYWTYFAIVNASQNQLKSPRPWQVFVAITIAF